MLYNVVLQRMPIHTNFQKDAKDSQAIRGCCCLTKGLVLYGVPVNQMKLERDRGHARIV